MMFLDNDVELVNIGLIENEGASIEYIKNESHCDVNKRHIVEITLFDEFEKGYPRIIGYGSSPLEALLDAFEESKTIMVISLI